MLLPLAHIAHWYFWPLYALPVLIVLWSVIATTLREQGGGEATRLEVHGDLSLGPSAAELVAEVADGIECLRALVPLAAQ